MSMRPPPLRGGYASPNAPTVPIFLVISYIYWKIPEPSDPEYADCFPSVAYPKTYPHHFLSPNIVKFYQVVTAILIMEIFEGIVG